MTEFHHLLRLIRQKAFSSLVRLDSEGDTSWIKNLGKKDYRPTPGSLFELRRMEQGAVVRVNCVTTPALLCIKKQIKAI